MVGFSNIHLSPISDVLPAWVRKLIYRDDTICILYMLLALTTREPHALPVQNERLEKNGRRRSLPPKKPLGFAVGKES